MDPVTALGAAGSVVGIAGFGIQLSQILRSYLSQIWYAQERLEDVVEEIKLTTSALEEVYVFLEREVANIERGQPLYLFSGNSLTKIKATADKCLVIFWRVEATVSGNWPLDIEDQLIKKLIEFNNRLKKYTPGYPIEIQSELNSDPLGLRDKLRWPSKSSKLDKYCKQLQRYQDSIVLLLHVVSLGRQRLKPNPTKEDIRSMQQTYTIIHRIVSPEELRVIAFETETQSQYRHGNVGREHSVAPSYIKRPRTPSWATAGNLRVTKFPTNPELHGLKNVRYRNHSPSRSIAMSTSRARSPGLVMPQSPKRTIFAHENTSDVYTVNQPSSPPPRSRGQEVPANPSTSLDGTTQHENDLKSSKVDSVDSGTPPQAQVNGAVPNEYVANGEQATRKTPASQSQGVVANTEGAEKNNAEVKPSPSSPQDSSRRTTQSVELRESRQSVESSDGGNVPASEGITKGKSNIEVHILPYVLSEEGAYQLPVSLGLELEKKLQGSLKFGHSGRELAERLAFLSPSQVQTLRNILRHNSGDQIRRLVHLEVVKKPSMKFWQTSARVMIAFVEGEISNMPEGVSLAVTEPTSPEVRNADSRLPGNTTFSVPQQQISVNGSNLPSRNDSKLELLDAERSRTGREGAASTIQIQDVQQDLITHPPSAVSTSAQPPGRPNGSQILGLSGIQDVTSLLIMNGQWAEGFAEYKVWTIQPFPSIDQAHTPSDVWGRCVISEEHLNISEVRRRLAILDKNPMTVLEKMTSLAVSQQIQVQQSLEAAKSNAVDPSYHWKFRQLGIIRSKRWLRPKYVKKIVVYVCVEPPLQAFGQPEESREQHRKIQEGASNPLNGDQLLSAGHQTSHAEDKKKSKDVASTDSDDTSSTRNSRKNSRIRIRKDENDSEGQISEPEEEFSRRLRVPRDAKREIERANEAIASRRPIPSVVSRTRSQSTLPLHSSEYARIRYPTRIPSPQAISSTDRGTPQPIVINNRMTKYDYDSANESDSSELIGHPGYSFKDDWHPRDHHNRLSLTHTNDEDGLSVRIPEREAELEDKIYRLRRDIDAQRDGTPHPSNHVSADRDRDLQLRRSSLSRSSYSAELGRRRGSMSTSRSRPPLLGYYTAEELRERTRARQGYPEEFDREPYDPQLSPHEVEAREEAIEQLLLEWTPLYKAEYDNDDDNADPEELKGNESSSVWSTGRPHSTIAVTEEPEELHDVLQPKETTPLPTETTIDIQVEHPSEDQAREAPVAEEPTSGIIEGASRIAISQQPPPRLQRRETTDGIDLVKPSNGQQPFHIDHTQALNGKADHDIGIHPLQKGDRAATLPTPTRQTWADIDWARNIVEETATVADSDEYEPPLRNPLQSPVTMRVLDRGSSPRERGRQRESEFFRARQERDIEHHRSPTVRRRSRNRSRVELRHEGSFERRPSPPPRRRTVEFEGLADRRAASRGRYQDQVTTTERRDYVSEPRQRQQSRTRVREHSPYTEPYAERERYYRPRQREDRHSSRH